MLSNITCQIEELQFIRTCFSHATNKQLIRFILLITSKEKIIGPHRQRIATIIQANTHAYGILFLITPGLQFFMIKVILINYESILIKFYKS